MGHSADATSPPHTVPLPAGQFSCQGSVISIPVLTRYIGAWAANDVEKIADSVAESCIITECYGPVYHGRE